jgi:hypothetical protein
MADVFPDALKGLALREELEHAVIEGEVIREDTPLKTGTEAVRKKLEARKGKPVGAVPATESSGVAVQAAPVSPPPTGSVSLADVVSAYKRAETPGDIRIADALGKRLGTEPDRIAAIAARTSRIRELSETVDEETGEITKD